MSNNLLFSVMETLDQVRDMINQTPQSGASFSAPVP
jgi:hypothetical protein